MNDIEKKLRQGMRNLTPDVLAQVLSSRAPKLSRADWEQDASRKSGLFKITCTAALLAACFFLLAGVSFYRNNLAVNATIDLDVNPSIELVANKKDQILRVEALNQEGIEILDGMNLKKSDITVGINAIIGSMVRKGYITELQNSILVTVQSQDTKRAEELQASIAGDIQEILQTNQISGSVYHQNAQNAETASAREVSEQYAISVGRAVFLLRLTEKDSSISVEDLASKSLQEIADIIRERKIDISDIAGYEHDDSVEENLEEIIEDHNEHSLPDHLYSDNYEDPYHGFRRWADDYDDDDDFDDDDDDDDDFDYD